MDDLSSLLNCCNTGCVSGDTIINHLKYAYDLVLVSPSATGMKLLLCACEVYSLEHAIYIYNSVLTRRHRHINSSASTPPNATKIAEMKDSHHGLEIVGPELLFSTYKWVFLEFVCAR